MGRGEWEFAFAPLHRARQVGGGALRTGDVVAGHAVWQPGRSDPSYGFNAAGQLSTTVTDTDRASSVTLLTRKRVPSGAGA